MAHSIQLFRGEYRSFNDFDLMIVLGLLLRELDGHQEIQGPLPQILANFHSQVLVSGPGTIEWDLDSIDSSQREKEAFMGLLSRTAARIRNARSAVPASVFQGRWPNRKIQWLDVDLDVALSAVREMQELFRDKAP